MQQSSIHQVDHLKKFVSIPIEKLDVHQTYTAKILTYHNPSFFTIYLPEKIDNHSLVQCELQTTMKNYPNVSKTLRYQVNEAVAAIDDKNLWFRAIIQEIYEDTTSVHIYFVDSGQEKVTPIKNIRPLPKKYLSRPALAIPCCLYQIQPISTFDQMNWSSHDPVHDEFRKYLIHTFKCKICHVEEQELYYVKMSHSEVGDLGDHLVLKGLASSFTMERRQLMNGNRIEPPPGFQHLDSLHRLSSHMREQSTNKKTQNTSKLIYISPDVKVFEPKNGTYFITYVYSVNEFYGCSATRKSELETFQNFLRNKYNNNLTDQSLNVSLFVEGMIYVIQQNENFYRVVIKHRESESRVLVKLLDRGDELLVDTSELLELEEKYYTMHAFAQPFCLSNFDATLSNAHTTRRLRNLILNQRVSIEISAPPSNNFYPVEIRLLDGRLVNNILHSKEPDRITVLSSNTEPIVNNQYNENSFPTCSTQEKYNTSTVITQTKTNFPTKNSDEQTQKTRHGFLNGMTQSNNDNYEPNTFFRRNRSASNYRNDNNSYRQRENSNHKRFYNTECQNNMHENHQNRHFYSNNYGQATYNNTRSSDRERYGNYPRRAYGNTRYRQDHNSSDTKRTHMNQNEATNNDSTKPLLTLNGWSNARPMINDDNFAESYAEQVCPDGVFEFVISHFETENDFFIQIYSYEKEITELNETLQREYINAPECNIYLMNKDKPCLVKSTDECWYRAIVLSSAAEQVEIRFVDFGDKINVKTKSARRLDKKYSLKPPYAYRCTWKNASIVNPLLTKDNCIAKCCGKRFRGTIETSSTQGLYYVQSNDMENVFSKTNCLIVYVDIENHYFYIQINENIMKEIRDEISNSNEVFHHNEINQGEMVIAKFEDVPYRAIIQSNSGDNVSVHFIDYGNSTTCLKSSLIQCNSTLKKYPPQAVKCCLYGVSSNDLNRALKQLEQYIEMDHIEMTVMKMSANTYSVNIFVDGQCFNKEFSQEQTPNESQTGFADNSHSEKTNTTATTVAEQEPQLVNPTMKRNNDQIISPISSTTLNNVKRQKGESETIIDSILFHQGILVHVDNIEPFIYVQLLPDSNYKLENIEQIVWNLVDQGKRNDSYEVNDYVIARYSKDQNYYRARIQSKTDRTCSVYFVDYGNNEENISLNDLYGYSDDLKQIEDQAHRYSLESFECRTRFNRIRSLLENKIEKTIEFYFTNDQKSIIHIKFENDEQFYNQPKTFHANIVHTDENYFYIHILPQCKDSISKIDRLLNEHEKNDNQKNNWSINDLCICYHEKLKRYYRARICLIDNENYHVECIDYGYLLTNVNNTQLYSLENEDLKNEQPIVRKCRLYGVDDNRQKQALKYIIQNIRETECVTITVDNDQNDQYMSVMLFTENNEIINDQYQLPNDSTEDKDNTKKIFYQPNSSDSAIATDHDTSNGDIVLNTNEQHLASPIGIPQAESTHRYGDMTNIPANDSTSITINQTIDFGENDLSTINTIIGNDTENQLTE